MEPPSAGGTLAAPDSSAVELGTLLMSRDQEEPVELLAVDSEAGRRVGLFELTLLVYMLSCGGPFGIEPAVGAAGALLTFVALVVVACVWVAPQALVAAELSLLTNSNGGSMEWVDLAFRSNAVSHFNGCMVLFSSLTSYSLLVVLVAEYLPLSIGAMWAVKCGCVAVCVVINIFGPNVVARFSLALVVLVFVPFVLMAGVASLDGSLFKPKFLEAIVSVPQRIRWDVFGPTVTWCFGSFDAVGNLAGEVRGGRRTFLFGLAIAFPMVLVTYVIPTLFALSVEYDFSSNSTLWIAGGFSQIAAKQVPWMGISMDVAGSLSNFGQYCACVAAVARVAWYGSLDGMSKILPAIVGWSYNDGSSLAPVAAIVVTSAAMLALTAISFDVMVQMFLFARVCNLMCIFAAFVTLRFTEPDMPRAFAAPGNKYVAILYGIPSAVIGVASLFFTDGLVWIINGAFLAGVALLYVVKRWWLQSSFGQQSQLARRYSHIK